MRLKQRILLYYTGGHVLFIARIRLWSPKLEKHIFITFFIFALNRILRHIFYPNPIHVYPIFTTTIIVGLLVKLVIKFTPLEKTNLPLVKIYKTGN